MLRLSRNPGRKRSRLEIIAVVLRTLRKPTCKTIIIRRCNLGFKQSEEILGLMRMNDLVRMSLTAGKVMYQRTETGRQFLHHYNQMALMLDPSIPAASLM